ncbi:ParB/Srx family N-terminal domain-containing protein [Gilliamella sp. ESL0250]|uniref:ParB/Srx family N-terminal domain-containing protein n=1 Tax=Gilliamella sp. ESL0250 TaxID=2705036 RepID=UPI001EE9B060|nr:ParB/Srx family N-terminal domain-containing protein [Gilliamella sp. ESL0250]
MNELKIIYKKVSDLKKYIQNSRTHSEEQIQQIINSVIEFGWTNPILIDENDIIIAGHGRLDAAKELGLDKVPCIVLYKLTESQKRAYLIADNKLSLNASWDIELLRAEIESLQIENFDVNMLGFSETELNSMLNDSEIMDIDIINDISTSKNFIIKCSNLDEYNKITSILHCKKMNGEDFLNAWINR